MSLSTGDLFAILKTIWSTQLGFDLDQNSHTDDVLTGSQEDLMTGIVQISGGFAGAIHLICGRSVVRAAAARMFSVPEADLKDEDLRDALGELANIFGGNVKALLPGSEFLSLPTVIEGSDYGVARMDSDVVEKTEATYRGQPLRASLFKDQR